FCGAVVIPSTIEEARAFALKTMAFVSTTKELQLSMWCDGSYINLDESGGLAVVHNRLGKVLSCQGQEHIGRAWPATPTPSSAFTESLALAQAIVQAMGELEKLEENIFGGEHGATICVRIFSDCRGVLSATQKSKYGQGYREAGKLIVKKSEQLRLKFRTLFGRPDIVVDLSLHWVPGHDQALTHHQKADKLAKREKNRNKKRNKKLKKELEMKKDADKRDGEADKPSVADNQNECQMENEVSRRPDGNNEKAPIKYSEQPQDMEKQWQDFREANQDLFFWEAKPSRFQGNVRWDSPTYQWKWYWEVDDAGNGGDGV
ncbi:hypothetical protein B0T20DRAFT_346998, partial [Sordaria brevicollis]